MPYFWTKSNTPVFNKAFKDAKLKFGAEGKGIEKDGLLEIITPTTTKKGAYVCGGSIVLLQGMVAKKTMQAEFYQDKTDPELMLILFSPGSDVLVVTFASLLW